ncbi:MAG: D-alanine--D-alanine ligase [Lachnospiraceae bacterium]|nr:D-alanine--D-alanine ligase [Lachnospiraceae bacterium]
MEKKTVVVLFGGQSSEHEVSCVSVRTVIAKIDRSRYDVLLIGITKEGRWLYVEDEKSIVSGDWQKSSVGAILSPDASMGGVLLLDGERVTLRKADVVFPVLHGLYGEDGTIQGILELAGIPYVGCGVLSSAVSMDKLTTKRLVEPLGIVQARYVPVLRQELADMEAVTARVEESLAYPVFVKPSNAGSSRGVSKARSRKELAQALRVAAAEDGRILVEETIVGRELECAVLQDADGTRASGVGEILAAAEFYDYDAKYNNADSRTVLSPELPAGKEEEIRRAAEDIFRAVDGRGLARVDFFLENGTNRVVFNEINTLPGFTSISMYPMLWEERGVPEEELVEKLIQSAYAR